MNCTKGEWKFQRKHAPASDGIKVSDELFSSITSDERLVCLLPEPHYMPDTGDRTWYNGCVEAMKANANLIAAAPDQNKALVEVLGLVEELLPTGQDITEFRHKVQNIIRSALAKAEGK